MLSFPLLAGGTILAQFNTPGAYAVVFFGQVFLNLNWAIVSDIVLVSQLFKCYIFSIFLSLECYCSRGLIDFLPKKSIDEWE